MAEYNLNINFYIDTYIVHLAARCLRCTYIYPTCRSHAHSSYVCTLCIQAFTHTHRFAFAKFMQNDAAIFVSDRCFGLCTRKEA